MRMLSRAFTGLIRTAVSAYFLGYGGWRLYEAAALSEKPLRGVVRERAFVVDAGRLDAQQYGPKVTAYGVLQAWTTLEIRAPAAGPITEISPNVRDGLAVAKGELLFRIDPEIASRRVTDAKAALAQAEAELAEAQQSRKHLDAELTAAKAQVRRADRRRKQQLFNKKLVTASALDEIRLALSAAEQAVIAKEQAQLALSGRNQKAEAGVARAKFTLSDDGRAS
jgi:multidrug efflux pump subunit AcrA (membrane-fusion protein)